MSAMMSFHATPSLTRFGIGFYSSSRYRPDMARRYAKDKEKEKEIAKEHIDELFSEAEKVFSQAPGLSDSYVKKARDIQMKFKLKMPGEHKRKFCKHCYAYIVPSVNCRVRISGGKVVYYCLACRKFMRFPLKNR